MLDLSTHHLFDGAMGTMLQRAGLPAGTPPEKWNLSAPEKIENIHAAYAAAGAPGEIGTFMGNIAGALATNIIGNKESVEKVNVLKYAGTLLNV